METLLLVAEIFSCLSLVIFSFNTFKFTGAAWRMRCANVKLLNDKIPPDHSALWSYYSFTEWTEIIKKWNFNIRLAQPKTRLFRKENKNIYWDLIFSVVENDQGKDPKWHYIFGHFLHHPPCGWGMMTTWGYENGLFLYFWGHWMTSYLLLPLFSLWKL